MTWAIVMTATAAAVLGFAAGLLTFKRSTRWCPSCGASMACPACGGREGVTQPPAVAGLNRGAAAS